MRILIISKTGRMLGIAHRLQTEGHSIQLSIMDDLTREVGDGIVPKLAYDAEIDEEYNLIIAEDYIPGLHRKGIPVFGGHMIAGRINGDIRQNASVIRLAGIKLPLDKAIDGVALSVGAFWDGNGFAVPHLVWADGDAKNYIKRININAHIFTKGLGLLARFMKKTDYRGYVRLRFLLAGEELYGLGLNMACEPEILQTLFELKKGDIGELFNSVAIGQTHEGEWHNGIAAGVRVSRSGYYMGIPIDGIVEDNSRHIWLQSALWGEDRYHCVQTDNPILYVTAGSNNLYSCVQRIGRTMSNIKINGSEYNLDFPEDITKTIIEWL